MHKLLIGLLLMLPLIFGQALRAHAAPPQASRHPQHLPNLQFIRSPRQRILFNDNWRFRKNDPPGVGGKLSYEQMKGWIEDSGADFSKSRAAVKPGGNPGADVAFVKSNFDDSKWDVLTLPHDWAVKGPFEPGKADPATGRLKFWGPVWYRKHFNIPQADANKKIYLDVDGAMSYSQVWLNGQFVGGWPYGYASFRLDLTPFVKTGKENLLAIRLDSPPESSRWYPGAGIYRNVWLVKTAPVHVGQWGTFVTTPNATAAGGTVKLQVKIDNDTAADTIVSLKNRIYELDREGVKGKLVATSQTNGLLIGGKQSKSTRAQLAVTQPKLWSIKTPNRYVVVTSIEHNGALLDTYDTPFGIRTIKFDSDKGFLLNGEHVRLNGVCNHHDLGALGTALNVRALERQLETLKEMGCNAIRTSHNPPAPELLDLCDSMGFVVMDEAFDCWVKEKRPGDYHLLFPAWHEKDLRAQIRRDRNHPCVVLWSIGNEIAEQDNQAGHEIARQLVEIAHQEDTTRPVTAACHSLDAGYNGFQKIVDVFGYNYKPKEYGRFHEKNPAIALFGSETASCISSRGEYFFPVSENQSDGKDGHQISSYDLYAPWWATTPDLEFAAQDKNPNVAGEFVWTGFDYIGEPTPYDESSSSSRSSYFGILDLAGFKKDRFYLYQAKWRPDFPMAHILPHWNWPERIGQTTPVHVYTSGDEAELFLNGKSLGRKKKGNYEYRLRWNDVVYAPGELKVVAYKNGKEWAAEVVKTSGPAAKLTLQANRNLIKADGRDLAFVTVSITDKDGQVVPRSKNEVSFSVEGPGEIVATDNGDPTDPKIFSAHERKAFNGLCLAIVRAKRAGAITLKAQSNGLDSATVQITGQREPGCSGIRGESSPLLRFALAK